VLTWSLDEPQPSEAALQLCGLLEPFWMLRAQSREGRKWCDAAVARVSGIGRTAVYAKAVLAAGTLAYRLGDYGAARTSLEQALAVAKFVDDRTLEVVALNRLGNVALNQANFSEALATYRHAAAVCREIGDHRRECGTLQNLASLAINQGDFAAATDALDHARSLSSDLNDRAMEARVLTLMGGNAWYRRELAAAQGHFEESLSICDAIGARTEETASLHGLAQIAVARGDIAAAREFFLSALAASREHSDPNYLDEIAIMAMALSRLEDSARFAGAADALRHAFGLPIWPVDGERFHEYRERCRKVLGDAAYNAAYVAGRVLTPDGAVNVTREWLQRIEEDLASSKSPD